MCASPACLTAEQVYSRRARSRFGKGRELNVKNTPQSGKIFTMKWFFDVVYCTPQTNYYEIVNTQPSNNPFLHPNSYTGIYHDSLRTSSH
jgi:hypothetical protein